MEKSRLSEGMSWQFLRDAWELWRADWQDLHFVTLFIQSSSSWNPFHILVSMYEFEKSVIVNIQQQSFKITDLVQHISI